MPNGAAAPSILVLAEICHCNLNIHFCILSHLLPSSLLCSLTWLLDAFFVLLLLSESRMNWGRTWEWIWRNCCRFFLSTWCVCYGPQTFMLPVLLHLILSLTKASKKKETLPIKCFTVLIARHGLAMWWVFNGSLLP